MKHSKLIISLLLALSLCLSAFLVYSRVELSRIKGNAVQAEEKETNKKEDIAEEEQQYKRYRNILSQDEIEDTLFGQPISTDRNGEYRIGIKCPDNGDFHATLTVYIAENGEYKELFSCPAVIGKNGAGKQSEGDVKTPLGTWKIGEAYGIKDSPETKLNYTKVTDDMYWCATGDNSDKYNKLIYASDEPNADHSDDEHLIDYSVPYAYFIDLGYNSAGAPYAGNAIFLHCWKGEDSPTGGCVAVSEENMIKILETIDSNTVVTIY
mgnify:CR=1 FL=1